MLASNRARRIQRHRGIWLAALMATTALGLAIPVGIAQAQTAGQSAERAFDIPAQPLADALIQFARQAGLQVSAETGLVANRRTAGVKGTMGTDLALATLLSGTGLAYRINGSMVAIGPGAAAGGETDGSITLDTVSVTATLGGAEDAPYRTAGSSSYISAEQIRRVPPSSTGDMFRSTPGIISAGNRNGVSLNLNVRGLQGMNRVATLVDGAQQTTSTYRGYGGYDNRTFVDPELLGGIEIERGPGSGAMGAGSMGGVVNMTTLNPSDIILGGKSYGIRVTGGFGSNSVEPEEIWPNATDQTQSFTRSNYPTWKSRTGSLAAAYADENFQFLAAIAHRKNGNYYAGAEGRIDVDLINPRTHQPTAYPMSRYKPGGEIFNTSQDTTTILLKGGATFGDGHSLKLSYQRYFSIYGEEYPDGNNPYSQWAWIGQAPLSDVVASTYTANYAWAPADSEWIDLHANVWMSVVDDNWTAFDSISEVFTRGGELWNTSKLETGIGLLGIRYGGQYTIESVDQDSEIPTSLNRNFNGKRQVGALFTHADLDLTDWLRVSGGLRYETYALEGENWKTELEDKDDDIVLPRAGITFTPLPGFQIFTTYSEGWRAPSVRETLFDMDNLIQPNPYLRPETSKNYEIGANYMHEDLIEEGDALRVKLAYFHSDYKDFISRAYGGEVGLPFPYRTFANINAAKFRGYELSMSYDMGYLFVEGNANYYTDVQFCNPNADNDYDECSKFTSGADYGSYSVPPRYAGSVVLGTRLFDEKLELGGRVTFAGERAVGRESKTSSMIPSGWRAYEVYDLFASYEINQNFSVNLSAENLLDLYYLDAISSALTPSPGRTIRTRFVARF